MLPLYLFSKLSGNGLGHRRWDLLMRWGRSVLCFLFLAVSGFAFGQSPDSDGDGISDIAEGDSDSDGDGQANRFDLDSDGDGLSDAVEGGDDADGDGSPNFLDLDSDADGLTDAVEGTFDSFEKRTVASELRDAIAASLPEGRNVDASFLNPAYKTDLTLTEEAEVSVTFFNEGAGYKNSLGYYAFPANAFDLLTKGDVDTDGSGIVSLAELQAVPGVEIGWIFPNASKQGAGGSLLAGDTVTLGNGREFSAGTTIGFFLVQNAWLGNRIMQPTAQGTRPQVMFTSDFLNPEAAADAGVGVDSSDGKLRHTALLFADQQRDEILMGFEDLNRTNRYLNQWNISSDEDFNDAVFTVFSSPRSALGTVGIPTVSREDAPDTDGDGILDADEIDGDTDGDGTPNFQDPDDDGDGIVTPTEGNADTDGDGELNYLDTDSDGDGIGDSEEGSRDTDLDGSPDFLDTDSDGDGVSDSEEAGTDTDGDGLPNRIDSDDDGDGIPTSEEGVEDFDEDGVSDYLDTDSDNDTVPDENEAVGDTDSDGSLDRYDTDDDNDGILSSDEGYADPDGDGYGNQVDLDSDNDTVPDTSEFVGDTDGDGLGDAVDPDDDGDGIGTAQEGSVDTDGDGFFDYLDLDSDGDGLTDDVDFIALVASTKALQENYSGFPLFSGDRIKYEITIANEGMETATGVLLSGIIPLDTSYVASSLKVDEVEVPGDFDVESVLALGSIAGGATIEIEVMVEVVESLPETVNKIVSAAIVTYAESPRWVYSDNDTTGHCGIADDGLDRENDFGDATDDDDPSSLPLSQGVISEHCNLAFEDLQNVGWCDWDMNDLVLDIWTFYQVNEINEVESLTVRYQILARGAGMNSRLMLSLPYSGFGEWQSLYFDTDGSIEESATGSANDLATVAVWESSMDALPPYTGLKYQWGAARTERFDPSDPGKVAVVKFYFDEPSANLLGSFPDAPFDTWAYIHNTKEEIHQMEYSVASTQIVYEGPLFGRSLPFVVKFDAGFVWPAEGQAIWNSHPDYVDHIKSGWTENLDWGDSFDPWRVWFDDEGKMPGIEEPNPVAESDKFKDYVNEHSNP